jgi:hypothetical protein
MVESKIYEAMANILKDSEAIGKDQKNKDQGFSYRGIDDVYNSLHSIIAKHKVFTIPNVLERWEREIQMKSGATWLHIVLKVSYKFYTVDGSFVEAIVFGEGRDSSDKGSNKALAIAHKYSLLQAFCIPTAEDKDPDSQTVEGKLVSHTPQNTPEVDKTSPNPRDNQKEIPSQAPSNKSSNKTEICQFGKNKGQRWDKMPPEQVLWYIDYFDKKVAEGGNYKESNQATLDYLLDLRDMEGGYGQ